MFEVLKSLHEKIKNSGIKGTLYPYAIEFTERGDYILLKYRDGESDRTLAFNSLEDVFNRIESNIDFVKQSPEELAHLKGQTLIKGALPKSYQFAALLEDKHKNRHRIDEFRCEDGSYICFSDDKRPNEPEFNSAYLTYAEFEFLPNGTFSYTVSRPGVYDIVSMSLRDHNNNKVYRHGIPMSDVFLADSKYIGKI